MALCSAYSSGTNAHLSTFATSPDRALVILAAQLRDEGKLDASSAILRSLIAENRIVLEARFNLAISYNLAGRQDLALATLDGITDKDLEKDHFFTLSALLVSCGDLERSKIVLERYRAAYGDMSAAANRRLAWIYCLEKNWSAVQFLLNSACTEADDAGESLFGLGIMDLRDGARERATDFFLKAYRAKFGVAEVPSAIERAGGGQDRFSVFRELYDIFRDDFCCCLVGMHIDPHEMQSYEFFMTRAWRACESRRIARALIDLDVRTNGDTATNLALRGHECWLQGQRAEADDLYGRARSLYQKTRIIPYHSNCGTLVWLPERHFFDVASSTDEARPTNRTQFVWTNDDVDESSLNVIVGCDANYFRFFPLFLLSAIKSVKENSEKLTLIVHCHVANATPEQLGFLSDAQMLLRSHALNVKLSYSHGESAYKERAYYTCLRFLVARDVIDRRPVPTFIMDIDICLTPEFLKTVNKLRGFDLGLRMDGFAGQTNEQVRGEPWTINAQSMYLSGSPNSLQFVELIRDYIASAYNPDNLENWTVDQCAVAQAYRYLIAFEPQVRTFNMSFDKRMFVSAQEYQNKDVYLAASGNVDMQNFFLHMEKLS